jgi:pheromone shutdown-related protein TraB
LEGEKRLTIVGTAHVSPRSIEEVKEVIERERPEAVAVELCYKRYRTLTEGIREDIPIIDVIKRGETFLLLFQLILSHFQKKIGEEYGVKPGDEMLAAIEKAKEIGADVLLIDRDITVTFKRFWSSLSSFEKLKLFFHYIRSLFSKEEIDVDEMLKEDVLSTLVKEFRKISPNAAKILIDERDEYMAANLLQAMQRYNRIVAVVGAGHKDGIERAMERIVREGVSIKRLEDVREGRSVVKFLGYLIPAAMILVFVGIILTLNTELMLRAFTYWFLINGVLAAIGAAIARGHPLSVLAAFLFAWLTSLNPMMAAGWVSGVVEAWIRKPGSSDLNELFDAESLREMMNNKLFRVLLVAALTNVGSVIGTIYGGYFILTHFGVDIAKEISVKFLSYF